MESTLSNAFLLMLIGMVTVLTVLLLVVAGGNILIKVVNSLSRDNVEHPKLATEEASNLISNQEVAIISAAVSQVVQGDFKIDSITKIDK